jgi:hypothetical protein
LISASPKLPGTWLAEYRRLVTSGKSISESLITKLAMLMLPYLDLRVSVKWSMKVLSKN